METFEIAIEELGVSQLYLNQRKLEAVREKTLEEGFAGFEPLPVYDFGDGRKVLTDGHSRAFVALQNGQKTLRVYWDNDPNTTGKLPQRMYRMCLEWCEKAGVKPLIQPIRGGTDGATLSFMGLPCPNLGTGDFACHGPFEHVCVEEMDQCVEVALNLVKAYAR